MVLRTKKKVVPAKAMRSSEVSKKDSMKIRMLLMIALTLTPMLAQQDESSSMVQVDSAWINPPESPMKMIQTVKSQKDELKELVLQNITEDKIISAYQIGWVTLIPQGCGKVAVDRTFGFAPVETIEVRPGEKVKSGPYNLSIRTLLDMALQAGPATKVLSQVGLVYVRFSNGEDWKYDLKKEKVFDAKGLDKSACPLLPQGPQAKLEDDPPLCRKSQETHRLAYKVDFLPPPIEPLKASLDSRATPLDEAPLAPTRVAIQFAFAIRRSAYALTLAPRNPAMPALFRRALALPELVSN